MESTIEIQKEFEILVSELERLKTINELTTINAESAKNVVFEIDKIANSAKQIHSSVELDFLQKNERIEKLLSQLSQTISKFEEIAQNNQAALQLKVNELTSSSHELISKNKETITYELDKLNKSLDNNKVTINSKLEELFANATANQKDKFNVYIQEINELHKTSTTTFLNSSNRFSNLIKDLSSDTEKHISFVQKGLQQINEQINKHITDNNQLVDNWFNAINANFNERLIELKESIEKNKQLNKRNGIFLIVLIILTTSILFTLLLK